MNIDLSLQKAFLEAQEAARPASEETIELPGGVKLTVAELSAAEIQEVRFESMRWRFEHDGKLDPYLEMRIAVRALVNEARQRVFADDQVEELMAKRLNLIGPLLEKSNRVNTLGEEAEAEAKKKPAATSAAGSTDSPATSVA